ncbi:hypothetical protein C8Q80DRAFT_1266777 [Daedaleopsis nitida]|nr:hypothetical protein C8Q80DRAFT_1266777 [Daedaleopsis nitida]
MKRRAFEKEEQFSTLDFVFVGGITVILVIRVMCDIWTSLYSPSTGHIDANGLERASESSEAVKKSGLVQVG